MRLFIKLIAVFTLTFAALAYSAPSSVDFNPTQTISVVGMPDKVLTIKEIKKAFIVAASQLRYTITQQTEDSLGVRLDLRQHTLEFSVKFTESGYTIQYLNSENLGFEDGQPPRIHPKVQQWLNNLKTRVAAEVMKL